MTMVRLLAWGCIFAGSLAFGMVGQVRAADGPAGGGGRLHRPSPLGGQGLVGDPGDYTAEEIEEIKGLAETVKRFEQQAADYRDATRKLVEHKYQKRRKVVFNTYEKIIVKLEDEQRGRRDTAIGRFESFVERYPDDNRYTPDAMFRLSELYFERSYDDYFQKRQAFDREIESWEPDSGQPEPMEPAFHYEPTIAMMQRLIVEFPDYRLLDGAYYLLGYCLGEQGEEDRAVDVYEELVARRPDSRFAAEVWTRVGEYYFDYNELNRALAAYQQVLAHADSPYYDKALYKLAWTHYRLADPDRAPDEFQQAVDTFVALLDFNERTKAEGKERGADLRKESIQYIAICYAEEGWGSTSKMLGYVDKLGNPPYERELMIALGDVYFDQTRYTDAVQVYGLVQERFGDHPEAPEIQEQIVSAFERDRDFESAAIAREAMTARFSAGSPWYEKNQDNEAAIRKAEDLTQKSLYSGALFHHKQAQIHRGAGKIDLAKEEYGKAATAYGEYLQRFPHDKQLYDLTFYYAESLYYSLQFEPAATEYIKVRDSTADTKFQKDAGFSAVLAYENAVKQAVASGALPETKVLTSADRSAGEPVEPKPIPELKLQVVRASDAYAVLAPENEAVPKLLYRAAEVYFTHDHLDEARRRFAAILQAYPQNEVAEYAANLTIESHLAEQNFDEVERFSRGLLERPAAPGGQTFRGELVKFKSGAMFKLADDLVAKGDYEGAAKMYLKMVEEDPNTQFADSAINNAAVAYEKVNRFDSASKLYERLVKDYPQSALADSALFRVGLNAERFFDFDKAIGSYLHLVDKYPKSDRRSDAIYNAALSLENTQDYERSAQQYLRYCQLFPNRDDAPQVCFRAGTVYEKMDDSKRVVSTYLDFIKKYRKNEAHRDRIIEAYLRIAKAKEKLERQSDARKHYENTVKTYQRKPDARSAPYAAEAQFNLVERRFAAFAKIKFDGTSRQQQRTLKKKAETLKKVEKAYMEILRFKQIDWTLAALFRIGQLYQNFAESLIDSPCPRDIQRTARQAGYEVTEVCDEYRVLLEERAANIEDKAVQAYETTINRAREFQVVNQWTKQTLVALNKLRRQLWPLQKDAKQFVDPDALSAPGAVNKKGAWAVPGAPEPAQAPAATPDTETATPAPAASEANEASQADQTSPQEKPPAASDSTTQPGGAGAQPSKQPDKDSKVPAAGSENVQPPAPPPPPPSG